MAWTEVMTDGGGILSFDGRVIEYFDERNRTSQWRVHVAHVEGWEVEQRQGVSRVKLLLAKRRFQNVLVADDQLPALGRLQAAVEAART